ncbi:hypothetical protein C8R43DRAFT_1000827 [Mycena crocata]|nr:hypothetical protein C8R43DRAFT_1000827 [Mycena crocata]
MRFTLFPLSLIASAFAAFPTKVVYDSPTGLFLENIAVRPGNELLLTSVMSPTLHTLDPTTTNGILDEVYTFPNSTGLIGIVEYQPDVYAVVASKLDLVAVRAQLGSVSIWRVDFTGNTPRITKVAQILNSTLINGLSAVPGHPDLVLAADSDIGVVYQISMRTGATRIAVQDSALAANAPPPEIGINGLRVRGGALYFTNSQRGTFGRVPVTVDAGKVESVGAVEVLGRVEEAGQQFDDFALDPQGRAWVTRHPDSLTVHYPLSNGSWVQEKVAGNLSMPTSGAFGRGDKVQEQSLYVTTGGGQST